MGGGLSRGFLLFLQKSAARARPRGGLQKREGRKRGLSPLPALGHAYLAAFSAARRVFFMSIVMVMGPTPPGTGVR